MLLGAVTKFPEKCVDYNHELCQVNFVVRRSEDHWQSIQIFNAKDVGVVLLLLKKALSLTVVSQGSQLRHHLTKTGLLFITLSDETVSFEEFFPGLEGLIAHVDFTRFGLRRPLSYTSHNNWKAAVDAYQECLHCAYAHPEFAKAYSPSTYRVIDKHNYSQHLSPSNTKEEGLYFYLFPNCTMSMYAGGLTCWRINPTEEPSRARMEFDYYHEAADGTPEFLEWYRFTRNVAVEDIELCEKSQANLDIGIYSAGLLNPEKEASVACASLP